jgi:acetyl-CoA carboxylase biotin carboxyl carrier protein
MIDIRKLKELVRLMVDNDLTELDLRDSEEQVTVRRSSLNAPPQVFASPMAGTQMISLPQAAVAAAPSRMAAPAMAGAGSGGTGGHASDGAGSAAAVTEIEAGLIKIESPMVGTFYAAANPDAPPFATVGTVLSPDKVVCIIEAMKIFNEIKAECSGTIQKVLVKNGDPVEFGQPLFLVKPD